MQLYDLDNDFMEEENIASGHPGKVKELMELLKIYILNGRSTSGKPLPLDEARLWAEVNWVKEL